MVSLALDLVAEFELPYEIRLQSSDERRSNVGGGSRECHHGTIARLPLAAQG